MIFSSTPPDVLEVAARRLGKEGDSMMAIEIIGPRYHLNEAFSANLKTGEVVVFPNTPEREHFWNVEVGRRLDELFDRLKVPQHLRGME